MPIRPVRAAAVPELVLIGHIDDEVGDVDAGAAYRVRVLGVGLGGDADEAVVVQVHRQGVQARQQQVHADVELDGKCTDAFIMFPITWKTFLN